MSEEIMVSGTRSNESNNSGRSSSSGTANSNVRDMTNKNRPGTREDDRATVPSQVTGTQEETNEASTPEAKTKQPTVGCSTLNLVGGLICGALVIGWLVFLFLENGGADLVKDEPAKSTSSSWNPPSSAQCTSIADGTLSIDGEPQEKLLVSLELQLQEAMDESDAISSESEWTSKLQEYVMPTLAGCESVTRRLATSSKSTLLLRQRHQQARRIRQLPDYIITHALVESSSLSWNKTAAIGDPMNSDLVQAAYIYPLAVNLLIWLREEVSADLLQEEVSQVFNDFLEDASLVTDLQLPASKLVSVEQQNGTNHTTTSPGGPITAAPSPKDPDVVTNVPVVMPTKKPTGFQTFTPSSSPTMMADGGNVTEPTANPVVPPSNSTLNQNATGNVTDSPTLSPSATNQTPT